MAVDMQKQADSEEGRLEHDAELEIPLIWPASVFLSRLAQLSPQQQVLAGQSAAASPGSAVALDASLTSVKLFASLGAAAMSSTVKLRKIGNSLGIILPKEVAERLRVAEGDILHIVTDADGARLTPFDPQFEAALEAFGRTRSRYRNALRALAK